MDLKWSCLCTFWEDRNCTKELLARQCHCQLNVFKKAVEIKLVMSHHRNLSLTKFLCHKHSNYVAWQDETPKVSNQHLFVMQKIQSKHVCKNQNFKNHQSDISQLILSKAVFVKQITPTANWNDVLTDPSLYLHTGQNILLNAHSF